MAEEGEDGEFTLFGGGGRGRGRGNNGGVIGKTSVYAELLVPLRMIATLETNTLKLLSFSFMRNR